MKVNGIRVQEKRIGPGDKVSISKHNYELEYSPADLGAVGPPPAEDLPAEIMTESLLARAGLRSSDIGRESSSKADRRNEGSLKRYDVLDDSAGQIDLPDKPV